LIQTAGAAAWPAPCAWWSAQQRHPGIVAAEADDHSKYRCLHHRLAALLFCGLCQEACPKGAIKLNNAYELAQEDKPP